MCLSLGKIVRNTHTRSSSLGSPQDTNCWRLAASTGPHCCKYSPASPGEGRILCVYTRQHLALPQYICSYGSTHPTDTKKLFKARFHKTASQHHTALREHVKKRAAIRRATSLVSPPISNSNRNPETMFSKGNSPMAAPSLQLQLITCLRWQPAGTACPAARQGLCPGEGSTPKDA